ncbi:ABC transporter ATP-binding protein [Allokutzneria oryzae]|uniref:ABC transporter ATP-binding protein n=1 Tax=Allokutzneria oryzae TaxID=1378989 RepID=A0ABV5ZWM3_9PSEU
MGVEVVVEGLSKSFGKQTIWQDVTLNLPPGEISVLLGPSGTGKSVFLKSLVGLLRPERGKVVINGVDICRCSEHKLYETRKLFGVLFQDGALFGSMDLFDNIAFPLREHTRKTEAEVRRIVLEKMEMVGLIGAEKKLPGEISGGMRKRAGLARALVLDPEIILFDEPDSGLDPVRVAYLNQLIVDLNAQIDATFLIVTHDIGTARTVPDNIGMLFRRELVMFGPREVLLTSTEPVVEQFLNGRRQGPIGMSEEKDAAQAAAELAELRANGGTDVLGGPKGGGGTGIVPQIQPSPGLPVRQAADRRKQRVMGILHTLPPVAREAIIASLTDEERARFGVYAASARPPRGTGARTQPMAMPTSYDSRPTPYPRNPAQDVQGPVAGPGVDVARLPESDWQRERGDRT